jgi:hypothetical protein
MAGFAVYDSEALDIIIGSIPVKEGRVKAGFLRITPDSANWGSTQDTSGKVTRYRTNNRLYTMELTLQQSSIHNAQFSALFGADHLATDGSGVASGMIKDNNGSTLLTLDKVWVEKAPDAEWGEEVKDWTWVFKVVSDPHIMLLGGN